MRKTILHALRSLGVAGAAALALFASPPAGAETFTSLSTGDSYTPPAASGTFDEASPIQYQQRRIGVHPPYTLSDFSGETAWSWHITDPVTGACSWYKLPGYAISSSYPLRNGDAPQGILSGGRIVGEISLTALGSLWNPYCNGAGVLLDNGAIPRTLQLYNMRLDRLWDGIRFGPTACMATPQSCIHVVADTWASNVRDDWIEIDGTYGTLWVVRSMCDRCFGGISATIGGASDHSADTIYLIDSLVRLYGWPYSATKPTYHVGFLKLDQTKSPLVVVDNTIIAFDTYTSTESSHWAWGWQRIRACTGNYLLYLKDGPLPTGFPAPPSCFTVLTGAEARAMWEVERREFVEAHPQIDRLAGE